MPPHPLPRPPHNTHARARTRRIISVDDFDKAAATVVKVAVIKKAAEEAALDVSFELPL